MKFLIFSIVFLALLISFVGIIGYLLKRRTATTDTLVAVDKITKRDKFASKPMTEGEACKTSKKKNVKKAPKYKCTLCGRKFSRKSPHKCNGKYRKKGFKWKKL